MELINMASLSFCVILETNQFVYGWSRAGRWKEQPLALVLLLKYVGNDQHSAGLSCITQPPGPLEGSQWGRLFSMPLHCWALSHCPTIKHNAPSHFRHLWVLNRLPRKAQYSPTCKMSTHEYRILVQRKSKGSVIKASPGDDQCQILLTGRIL